MAGNRGRRKPAVNKIVEEEEGFVEDEKPFDLEVVRSNLRDRWELASVLNFLRVFKFVIGFKMELSAEEIEEGLIKPNNSLSQLHICLLKGIPPVSKNLGPDAWVTTLIKKLVPWWPWVAEGEIPLIAGNKKEILKYNELDPMMRLLILKALCEIRAFQDDAVSYINDSLKEGTEISTFRKDRMGGDGNGTSYWYDGDESIGHRLYKEVTKVQLVPKSPKSRGKGRPTQPTITYQWKTIATNLEEFQQISIKLSSSKVVGEAAFAQVIEDEIVPVLEKIQKKKERALKRQQRQEMLLNGVANSYRTEGIRSCRNRKRVSYTFDEYDRSIDEALQLIKKGKTTRELKKEKKDVSNGHADIKASNGSCENNVGMDNDADYDKLGGAGGKSGIDDEDFDDKNDDDDDGDNGANGESASSENENNNSGMEMRIQKGRLARDMAGLRRSTRCTGTTGNLDKVAKQPADTMKKLRQRPTRNTGYEPVTAADSEDSNLSEKTIDEASNRVEETESEKENIDASEGEENIENEEKMDATEIEEDNLENEEEMDATESEEENIETEEQMEATESEEENSEKGEKSSENEKVDVMESEEDNIESEGEATQSDSEEN